MSVQNETYKVSYDGRGDTGPYPITFEVNLDDGGDAQDIVVKLLDSAGTETDITSTATITGMNVYTALTYDATYDIVLIRYPTLTQPYTFPFGTKFPSRTFEKALDRNTFAIQRLALQSDQSLKGALSEVAPARLPSIADRGNHLLGFDTAGDPIPADATIVPVTPFMQTVLDDTTADDAKTTLGVRARPYLIAADDSTDEWKLGADYVLGAAEDLGAAVNAARTAGEKWIVLAPSPSYTYTTSIYPNSTTPLKLQGSGGGGAGAATVITSGAAVSFLKIGASQTTMVDVSDLHIEHTGTAFATLGVCDGYDAIKYQRWTNVTIRMSSMVAASGTTQLGFNLCENLRNCHVVVTGNSDNDARMQAFVSCEHLDDCSVVWSDNATLTAAPNTCFRSCNWLVNCKISTSSLSTTGGVNLFYLCTQLVNCRMVGDDTGISGNHGFNQCENLINCFCDNVVGTGFHTCNGVVNCWSNSNGVSGFVSCDRISGCSAASNGSYGYNGCARITNCAANSNSGSGFYGCLTVIGNSSVNNTGWGFQACTWCQQNQASGNSSGDATTSFADAATNAYAATAAGGYNT